jgi:hypothetical protein
LIHLVIFADGFGRMISEMTQVSNKYFTIQYPLKNFCLLQCQGLC